MVAMLSENYTERIYLDVHKKRYGGTESAAGG